MVISSITFCLSCKVYPSFWRPALPGRVLSVWSFVLFFISAILDHQILSRLVKFLLRNSMTALWEFPYKWQASLLPLLKFVPCLLLLTDFFRMCLGEDLIMLNVFGYLLASRTCISNLSPDLGSVWPLFSNKLSSPFSLPFSFGTYLYSNYSFWGYPIGLLDFLCSISFFFLLSSLIE